MRLKTISAAAVLAVAATTASAVTSWDLGPYTVTYDEATPFGFLAGAFSSSDNSVGFNWNVPTSVSAFLIGGGASSSSYALPSFTVTANAGYTLSGPVTGFLGNVTFTELLGGSVSVSAGADVAIDAGPSASFSGPLTRTETNGVPGLFTLGYFSGEVTSPPMSMQSFSVSNGSLTVDLSGAGPSSFASLQGQPQNQLRVSFTAAPIPEPGTYALLLAGLGAVGFIARRRKS